MAIQALAKVASSSSVHWVFFFFVESFDFFFAFYDLVVFLEPVRRRLQCRGLRVKIAIMELEMVVNLVVDVGKFGAEIVEEVVVERVEIGIEQIVVVVVVGSSVRGMKDW